MHWRTCAMEQRPLSSSNQLKSFSGDARRCVDANAQKNTAHMVVLSHQNWKIMLQ
jgi:hypothetical protein